MRLAQQLMTTVGTLVVAVSGFYFGASSVSAALGVQRLAETGLSVIGIVPEQGPDEYHRLCYRFRRRVY